MAVLLSAAAPAAADPFARCEAFFSQAPERWESSRCFYEVAGRERLWGEAARRLEALAARHPDRVWLLLARAYVEEERDAERAADRYRAAIAAFADRGDAEGEVRARCAFAAWLSGAGKSREAGDQLAAAVARAQATARPDLMAEALIFQARHLRELGTALEVPYGLALRAESYLFPHGPAAQQMLCLELLASLARDLGRPDRAALDYRRLRRLARASGRRSLEARAELGLGLLLFDELDRAPRDSQRAQVAAQLRRALKTAGEVGDPVLQARIHSILGRLLDPPEAREHLNRCLTLARGRDDVLTASCLLSAARAQADIDPEAAEQALEAAGAVARRSGDLSSLARYRYGRMNFSWRFSPRERAIADSLAAIQAVEALRDRQLERTGRAGLFSRWLAPYYAASGHLLAAFQGSGDPEDLDRAFAITESMRARVLRDLLARPRSSGPSASRRAIEEGLAPEEALLSFQIAPRQDYFGFAGGSWLLVSTRAGTRVYHLPETVDRARLESAVAAFVGLIGRRDDSEGTLAAALFEQLLGDAAADLPRQVDRLVIVPDGVLHLLPFAALRPRVADPPLTERYQISVVPSATLWAGWRRQARRDVRAALVLADPAVPAALEETAQLRAARAVPLSGARREGRRVARRCGPGSRLRLGAGANEAFLKRQDFSRFGVLHLAAHAVVDEVSPEASGIFLAPGGAGEDGKLQVDEIVRLDLRGNLVAVASCRSSSGALVGGEGLMSLARAFFAGGAAVVVGNFWPLRDDDAEEFFAVFYDRLAAGEPAAAAFAAAQRKRIRDGVPTQSWAGFVLAGDGNWRLPRRPRSFRRAGSVLAAGLLALAAGYAVVRRRTRGTGGPKGKRR